MADLSNYLKQQYASELESELAGLENAYKQSTAMMDRTALAIPQEYEAKRNTAAATNALEKQAFDERANAMGLNTGTSGQAQLARSSMYQRDLAGIGAAEANAMADLNLQRNNRQAEYEAAMAAAKAESDAALNSALAAEMIRQQQIAYQKERDAVADAQWQKQFDAAQSQWEREFAAAQAQWEQELAAAQAAAKAENTAKNNGGGGGSSYNNGGLTSAQVKAMQEEINHFRVLNGEAPIAVDGKWGAETTEAANGYTASQYYDAYTDRRKAENIPEYKSIPKPR